MIVYSKVPNTEASRKMASDGRLVSLGKIGDIDGAEVFLSLSNAKLSIQSESILVEMQVSLEDLYEREGKFYLKKHKKVKICIET